MADPVVVIGATGATGAGTARRVAAAGGRLRLVAREPDATATGCALLDEAALASAVRTKG